MAERWKRLVKEALGDEYETIPENSKVIVIIEVVTQNGSCWDRVLWRRFTWPLRWVTIGRERRDDG